MYSCILTRFLYLYFMDRLQLSFLLFRSRQITAQVWKFREVFPTYRNYYVEPFACKLLDTVSITHIHIRRYLRSPCNSRQNVYLITIAVVFQSLYVTKRLSQLHRLHVICRLWSVVCVKRTIKSAGQRQRIYNVSLYFSLLVGN